jgi:deazaflavin-dependent oxidoreductase (nitroreductase family)
VGRLFARRPCLVLTTTGRRSGRPRTVILVYVLDGDRWVVVGSNMGSRRPPAWLLNLQDAPDATVTVAGRRTPVRATVASPEERERLWPIVDRRNYGQYGRYQALADRTILLVILEPVRG